TVSPIHTAGLALRFPRLIRFRDDKQYDEATTIKELRQFFGMQKQV
ncbi:MAG: putative DNA ligase, partial [Candidatus Woesebacteria bacterium GW2011_GWB1_45_5]